MEEEVSDRETLTKTSIDLNCSEWKEHLFHALGMLVKNGPLLINQKL